ncbi:MAG: hypothetical protein NTV63_02455, partial [Candidatus Woesearchaeota archaeon]|nr:hypothetical protein [Candidatus Woesearchaeota archaeon]
KKIVPLQSIVKIKILLDVIHKIMAVKRLIAKVPPCIKMIHPLKMPYLHNMIHFLDIKASAGFAFCP